MINLYDNESGTLLATITEAQLSFLIEDLEEEDMEDQDYYINEPTLEWLESQQADPKLISVLRTILGDREGLEIRWERT